jgi:hypothetical protein
MLRPGKSFVTRAAALALLGVCWMSADIAAAPSTEPGAPARRLTAPKPKPNYLWLWYADGKALPEDAPYCGDLKAPPAYQCNFGSSLADCQAKVQSYLDLWYKDFNVVFTLTRPVGGNYDTIVITSGWPDCATEAAQLTGGSASNEGGIAPGICPYAPFQTAVAIQCGGNAHDCATIIAHEHGHLAGLAHTAGGIDIMNAWIQPAADGFANEPLSVSQDRNTFNNPCGLGTQNSHKEMLSALGPWPGGTKPALFPQIYDGGVADAASDGGRDAADAAVDAAIDTAATGGSIGGIDWTSRIDGGVVVLPGFDAFERSAPVPPDVAPLPPAAKQGGCSLVQRPTSSSLGALVAALFACALLSRLLLRPVSSGSRRARSRSS